MKQEKVEALNDNILVFFFIVGITAWITLGIYTLANIQTYVYLFHGGYEPTINVYAIIGFLGWAIVSAFMVVVYIIGWWNEDEDEEEKKKSEGDKP